MAFSRSSVVMNYSAYSMQGNMIVTKVCAFFMHGNACVKYYTFVIQIVI